MMTKYDFDIDPAPRPAPPAPDFKKVLKRARGQGNSLWGNMQYPLLGIAVIGAVLLLRQAFTDKNTVTSNAVSVASNTQIPSSIQSNGMAQQKENPAPGHSAAYPAMESVPMESKDPIPVLEQSLSETEIRRESFSLPAKTQDRIYRADPVPYDTIVFLAEAGYEGSLRNGSYVSVEPGSLKLPGNSDASGKVLFLYRDIRSIGAQIALSLPSVTDSAGNEYLLENNGSFEVRIEQNGTALHTTPASPLSLQYKPIHTHKKAAPFVLENETGHWIQIPGTDEKAGNKLVSERYVDVKNPILRAFGYTRRTERVVAGSENLHRNKESAFLLTHGGYFACGGLLHLKNPVISQVEMPTVGEVSVKGLLLYPKHRTTMTVQSGTAQNIALGQGETYVALFQAPNGSWYASYNSYLPRSTQNSRLQTLKITHTAARLNSLAEWNAFLQSMGIQ
ncbi:MAG: hypothetical protein JNL57_03000 [Bacteroidetes bacterium]|nr:hypothetical protein [Bacteroidota bacterium]